MFRANARALKDGSLEITPEHILYGLLDEDPQLFSIVVPSCPNIVSDITQRLAAHTSAPQSRDEDEPLQLSDPAKEIIRVAAREKERLSHRVVGTQHLLVALLICPEVPRSRFRKTAPQVNSAARQALTSCGLVAESAMAATKDGLVTPQGYHLEDPLIRINSQLAALAELLTAKGIFTRTEYAALLDQNVGLMPARDYVSPLLEALVQKGQLSERENGALRTEGLPSAAIGKESEQT